MYNQKNRSSLDNNNPQKYCAGSLFLTTLLSSSWAIICVQYNKLLDEVPPLGWETSVRRGLSLPFFSSWNAAQHSPTKKVNNTNRCLFNSIQGTYFLCSKRRATEAKKKKKKISTSISEEKPVICFLYRSGTMRAENRQVFFLFRPKQLTTWLFLSVSPAIHPSLCGLVLI